MSQIKTPISLAINIVVVEMNCVKNVSQQQNFDPLQALFDLNAIAYSAVLYFYRQIWPIKFSRTCQIKMPTSLAINKNAVEVKSVKKIP